MFEIKRYVAGGMEARLGVLLQAMLHDALQRWRNIAIGFGQVRRVFLQNRAHRIGGRVTVKCAFARQHLVENCPKAEYVGARIQNQAPHLLGRHVSRRSQHHAGLRAVGNGWQ